MTLQRQRLLWRFLQGHHSDDPWAARRQGDKGDTPEDVVLYTPQTLTAEEMLQAQKNLGLAGEAAPSLEIYERASKEIDMPEAQTTMIKNLSAAFTAAGVDVKGLLRQNWRPRHSDHHAEGFARWRSQRTEDRH